MTPAVISRRTGIPIEHIKAGLEILEKEDPYSRTPDENGRRIIRLDEHRPWGWRIVNHGYYRDLASRQDAREKAAERQRRKREKDRQGTDSEGVSRGVTPGHGESRESRHARCNMHDADTDKGANLFSQFWSAYPLKKGKGKAQKVWDKLKPDESLLAQMLRALEAQKAERQQKKDAGEFVPEWKYPEGWLNGERWLDESEAMDEDEVPFE